MELTDITKNIKTDIENFYKFGKELGQGQFGVTRLATIRQPESAPVKSKSKFHTLRAISFKKGKSISKKDEQYVAIKIINKRKLKSPKDQELLIREVYIMRHCNHPHIIKYLDFYGDETNYYIVMEYIEHGELFNFVINKKISDENKRKIIGQIISAIEYLHGQCIAHRDIKLENVLVQDIDDFKIKLIDFGLANYVRPDAMHDSYCGSPMYAAPEIIKHEKYNPFQADIWSLGVLMYSIFTNHQPWTEMEFRLYNDIYYDFDTGVIPDLMMVDVFERIFSVPEHRITLSEIKKAIWLKPYILPAYLPKRPPLGEVKFILVDKMVTMGFDSTTIMTALYSNENIHEVAIYHILLEKSEPRVTTRRGSLASNRNYSASDTSLHTKYKQSELEDDGFIDLVIDI